MSEVAIKFENISKQYRLGLVSTRSLSHDLKRWWTVNVKQKEDPYLKIGETNDRSTKGGSEYVWALRDIDFEVKQGEVLGIIGKNGAGKSTLLKILSEVTSPTTGCIKANGRIASLLEVGTGFHPEMTGRENIFMNGAIMGMNKAEIRRKFDEIVAFSGVERYIDTPVKRYSSGMTVRLGFAIAAHLEPEILVVDEVLAVGDAEFQKKAIGKMQDVSRMDGRTVLFVSHNMGAVSRLCKTGLILKNGSISYSGEITSVIDEYLTGDAIQSLYYQGVLDDSLLNQIMSVKLTNDQNHISDSFSINENIFLEINIRNLSKETGIRCNVCLSDMLDNMIMVERIPVREISDSLCIKAMLPENILLPNRYKLSISLDIPNIKLIEIMPMDMFFEVIDTIGIDVAKSGDIENGIIKSYWKWNKE